MKRLMVVLVGFVGDSQPLSYQNLAFDETSTYR